MAPLPAPGTPVRPPAPRHRWWSVPLAVVGLALIGAVGVAGTLPASLVADKEVDDTTGERDTTPFARVPATAQPVRDRVQLGDLDGVAERDAPHPGGIWFVTISEPRQSLLSWFAGRDEPEFQPMTELEKYGNQTPSERRAESLQMMRTSEQVAQYVALRRVGYDVTINPGEVVIAELVCLEQTETGCARTAPADEQLDRGDRITSVEGGPIGTVEDLIAALAGRRAGDTVTLGIDRPDAGERTVEVELIASPDNPNRTIIGFLPFDTATVGLPFEVDIDTGAVGGPSAGVAFTLTLIDELSDGDLTGGRRVAVTGTIGLDGRVGAIGGLVQKASAVRQAGVDVFLVPAAQGEDELATARAVAGDGVTIVPVATLDEALAALEELGGDPVPPPD